MTALPKPPAQPARARQRVGLVVRVCVSAALIAAIVYYVGSESILSELEKVRWQPIAVAVLVLTVSVFVVTPRWVVILSALGQATRLREVVGSVFLGLLFNQVLPTAVGGDVVRAWRLRQLGVGLAVAVHSVLIDRAAGVFASLFCAIVLLPFITPEGGKHGLALALAAVVVAGATGALALWWLARMETSGSPLLGRLHRALSGLAVSTWTVVCRPGSSFAVLGLSIANQLLAVAAMVVIARALDVHVAAVDIAFITYVSALAMVVPISVAGWGVREGAVVYLFGLFGVEPEVAFTISLLFGAALTLSAAPGAAILVFHRHQHPPAEAAG